MKQVHIWVFCISLLSCVQFVNGQEQELIEIEVSDSLDTKEKTPLSLRFGADLYRLILSQTSDEYNSYEIVGDLRIRENLYIAMELGTIDFTQQSERVNFTTTGSYYKLGFDFNMYDNWEGMDNHVVLGMRFASSAHRQKLNSYQLLDRNPFWQDPETIIASGFATGESDNLSAMWLEFVVGFKVQLVKNVYAGLSLRLNRLLNDTPPKNFDNIYIPGFNSKTEDNKFGAGFNYTLSYRIPFRFKK